MLHGCRCTCGIAGMPARWKLLVATQACHEVVLPGVQALEDALKTVDRMSFPIDTNNRAEMLNVVNSCIATKFTHRFGTLMAVSAAQLLNSDYAHFAYESHTLT